MILHSLCCLLYDDKKASFKTVTMSSNPSMEKIALVYHSNVKVLQYILDYCAANNIGSMRISSGLFPLATHEDYREKLFPLVEDALKEYAKINYHNIHISIHPDQFILLSSDNDDINERSRYQLDLTAYMSEFIPIDLINIHVGSAKLGKEFHMQKFKDQFKLLDWKTQQLLSLENDEKSYSFSEVLRVAQENNTMIVPDFHHERCYQKRQLALAENVLPQYAHYHEALKNGTLSNDEHYTLNNIIDENIVSHLDKIVDTYHGRFALPTFHLSSPSCGWNNNFREHCTHADFIDPKDYPVSFLKAIHDKGVLVRLDIEARAKNAAIHRLEAQLLHHVAQKESAIT